MINEKYLTRGAYHHRWYTNKENNWYPKLVDAVVNFCEGSTLDLGTGDGLVAKLISEKGHDVTGIDADPVAIAMAQALVPDVRFLLKELEKQTKGQWDYLACLNTIEHLEDPEPILRALDKNIRKAGIIITDRADPSQGLGTGHVHEYTLDELLDVFKDYNPEPFEVDNFIGVKVYK